MKTVNNHSGEEEEIPGQQGGGPVTADAQRLMAGNGLGERAKFFDASGPFANGIDPFIWN